MRTMERSYWLVPRNIPALMESMMTALAGGAHIILEGELKAFDFGAVASVAPECAIPFHRESPESPDVLTQKLQLVSNNS